MSDLRFFVEKKKGFDLDAKRLKKQFKEELGVNVKDLRLINCYDIFNLNDNKEDIEKIKQMILSEPVTDTITTELDLKEKKYFAVEFLPGQFDQRADSALQCIDIVSSTKQNADVLTSKIIILNNELSDEELSKIKKFYINPIEMREKDLSVLKKEEILFNSEVITYNDFTSLNDKDLEKMRVDLGLSISFEDLKFIQEHFKKINRNPTETEIKVLDTYWSDHCRHTTFETKINKVTFPNSEFGKQMEKEFNDYLKLKEEVSRKRDVSLMDMATIVAKYLKKEGKLDNLEVSEENNACSCICRC